MPDRDRPRLVRIAGRTDWHVYWRDGAGRHRVTTGTPNREEAERFLIRTAGDLAEASRPHAPGISGILDAYLADRRDAKKAGADRLSYAHKPLKAFFGDRPPNVITAPECRRYQRARAAQPRGPAHAFGSCDVPP